MFDDFLKSFEVLSENSALKNHDQICKKNVLKNEENPCLTYRKVLKPISLRLTMCDFHDFGLT